MSLFILCLTSYSKNQFLLINLLLQIRIRFRTESFKKRGLISHPSFFWILAHRTYTSCAELSFLITLPKSPTVCTSPDIYDRAIYDDHSYQFSAPGCRPATRWYESLEDRQLK